MHSSTYFLLKEILSTYGMESSLSQGVHFKLDVIVATLRLLGPARMHAEYVSVEQAANAGVVLEQYKWRIVIVGKIVLAEGTYLARTGW